MDEVNKTFSTNPTLPEGIILQAVRDWRHLVKLGKESAVLGSNGTISLAEIREFFESEWCAALCGKLDPLLILRRLERERINGQEEKQEQPKRREITLEHNGETHTLMQWSRITGIKYQLLYSRLFVGLWSVERALTEPVNPHTYNDTEVHT